MKQALRSVGHYFGVGNDRRIGADRSGRLPGDAGFELQYLQPSLLREGISICLAALLATLMLRLAFDWPLSELLGATVAGLVVWGAVWYVLDTGPQVPNSALTPAPAGAVVGASRRGTWRHGIRVLPPLVALTWSAGQADVGGFLFPGMIFGYGAAHLVAAALVSRWEQEHGQRVVTAADGSGHGGSFAVASDRAAAQVRPVA